MEQGEPFEIRTAPGKGLGIFAKDNIKRGTRLLAELPLIVISSSRYTTADVQRAYDRLTPNEQATYMQLSSSHGQNARDWPCGSDGSIQNLYGAGIQHLPSSERRGLEEQYAARIAKSASVLSIFQNNCMEREGGAAVFPRSARLNHSCAPNAFFAWNVLIGMETVHAIHDIAAGEEITVSYCDPLYDRTLRAWQLKHYNFVCHCPVCTDDVTVDDSEYKDTSLGRRYRLRELSDITEDLRPMAWVEEEKQTELLRVYHETAGLLIEEGLRTGELGRNYIAAAALHEHRGEYASGLQAAKQGLEVLIDCFGNDNTESIQAEQLVRRLEANTKKESS